MQTPRSTLLLLRLARPLIHLGLVLACFYAMVLLRAYTDLIPGVQLRIPPIHIAETMMFAGFAGAVFLIVGYVQGLYHLYRPTTNYYMTFLTVRLLWGTVCGTVAYLGFGYVFTHGISRFVLLFGVLAFGLVATIVDLILNIIQRRIERTHPYRVLVLGKDMQMCDRVADTLQIYPIYTVEAQPTAPSPLFDDSYDIVLVAGSMPIHDLQTMLDRARIQGQRFYHIGDDYLLEDLITQPTHVGPLLALQYMPSPLVGRWRVVKRGSDIIVATIGLLVLLPVFVLIAIAIKIESAGPIFYIQDRVGRNKQFFSFVKFRSMWTHMSVGTSYGGEDAQKIYEDLIVSDKNVRDHILPKIEDDPRVTRVGKFLRQTSLDELPSLWNVLQGNMSLVGPRPHMPREVVRYDTRQERLFSVKPGMTGYAQIFGRDKLSFEEEARLDLYYIQHRSLFLDMYVVVNTVRVIFAGK